jgi:hypothetical protein
VKNGAFAKTQFEEKVVSKNCLHSTSRKPLTTMPLFGKSQKSPAELVKVTQMTNFAFGILESPIFVISLSRQALKEALKILEGLKTVERGDKKCEKAQEEVSKNLVSEIKINFSTAKRNKIQKKRRKIKTL